MPEVCQCPAAGFCARRNTMIPNLHWRRCQSGQVEAMDHLYSVQPAPATAAVGARPFSEPQPEQTAELAQTEQIAAAEGPASMPGKKCGGCSKRKPVK